MRRFTNQFTIHEMNTLLPHDDAFIRIEEINSGSRRIQVEMKDLSIFSPRRQWITRYPLDLIEAVLKVKGPAYLCDEIARDEDPTYVESDIRASLFSYVPKSHMDGKRLLDFGCGAGASTMIMSRILPNCHVYAVELEERSLALARRRAAYYHCENLVMLRSPAPDRLPDQIQQVDYILLSAVYEHLLPNERQSLLLQMWQHLAPEGILFINQTPDRRFPVETHTTGLPFINYLPKFIAGPLARTFSKRGLHGASWASLLRQGIRGATPTEIMRFLFDSDSSPVLLSPAAEGVQRQSDIWYRSARVRLSERYTGLQKQIVLALMSCITLSGVPVAPYISLAIRKSST
ncbi:class I SAM-dependent methyltransferase [candidate division KSB1 bacterium]|nr:MAG: class I SAM-dependent methyltransferase [candidate division KSB1 bacterium]